MSQAKSFSIRSRHVALAIDLSETAFRPFEADAVTLYDTETEIAASPPPDGRFSARSGLPRHEAATGLKRFDLEASASYRATGNWLVRGQAAVGFLADDGKESPIARSNAQRSGMLIVGYTF